MWSGHLQSGHCCQDDSRGQEIAWGKELGEWARRLSVDGTKGYIRVSERKVSHLCRQTAEHSNSEEDNEHRGYIEC
jgi:hypothetical protein